MRADRDSRRVRGADRGRHRSRIAGVKAAGNARGTDEAEELAFAAHAFAEIGIEIDLQADLRSCSPTRKRASSFARTAKRFCASAIVTS